MNPMKVVKNVIKNKVVQWTFLGIILVGVFILGIYRIVDGYEDGGDIGTSEIEIIDEKIDK